VTKITVPGALHMHTVYSDGTGTLTDVVAAARAAGLRWIIVTDHDTLEGQSYEGWRDDVLVIVDHEITPPRNHFLALNVDSVMDCTRAPQDFIDDVYRAGGFGIIAHPDERVRNDFKDIYRWDDWEVSGPRERDGRVVGIELWNLMSDWAEHLTQRNKLPLFLAPRLGLSGPSPATLAWWDNLNMSGRRTFGVAGVDAHAFRQRAPWGTVEVFPYRWCFSTLTNYLLLDAPLADDAVQARNQVYSALANGRCHFANRLDGDARALSFSASRAGATWQMGDTPTLRDGPLLLSADVGSDAFVRLIGNGRAIASGVGVVRHSAATPGVYRVEAYRGGKPWLYTNPIYIEG